MNISILFWVGLLLILGHFGGVMARKLNLPIISSYIFIGILLSPSVTNVLPHNFLASSSVIVKFSLSMIAFMIGGNLRWEKIKRLGSTIAWITVTEGQCAFIVVAGGLFCILPYFLENRLMIPDRQFYLSIALFLGALSSATAPAATLAIMHEYKSKGPLTSTVLGVVAMDDSLAMINYALVLSIVTVLFNVGGTPVSSVLAFPLKEIFLSVPLGVFFGFIMQYLLKGIHKNSAIMTLVFGIVLCSFSLAEYLGLDGLLTAMATGITFTNVYPHFDRVYGNIENNYEELIFILFFIISGAHIDMTILLGTWHITFFYILLRIVGKMSGAYLGAVMSHAPDAIKKYAGFALVPQAGVALGLALILHHKPDFKELGYIVLNIIIASTAIHELIGPFFTRYAIFRAGEAKREA